MGTEHPDTGGMHRLFDDALADADLTGDVVPGVLAGYGHQVKVRRYQGAGVALAVLATAGVTIAALPRGGDDASRPTPANSIQGTDYCTHQHWVATPRPQTEVVNELSADPAADQANCEALRTALHTTLPDAQLVPRYTADLTLDPRVDQTLVKQVDAEIKRDPLKWTAEQTKYFGSELKYLAVHPEDPANVYTPDSYEVVVGNGRDGFSVTSDDSSTIHPLPKVPLTFVGSPQANDCATMPATLSSTVRCTPVGIAGGWHGAQRWEPEDVEVWMLSADLTDSRGTNIRVEDRRDNDAWYREGMYDGTMKPTIDGHTKWINRWTGQTAVGTNPPAAHVVSEKQLAQFLDSPAFQKYADSYRAYIGNLSKPQGGGSPNPTPIN